jgi:hypothetical protein
MFFFNFFSWIYTANRKKNPLRDNASVCFLVLDARIAQTGVTWTSFQCRFAAHPACQPETGEQPLPWVRRRWMLSFEGARRRNWPKAAQELINGYRGGMDKAFWVVSSARIEELKKKLTFEDRI